MDKKKSNKSTDPLDNLVKDTIRRKDGDTLKKITISNWGIHYDWTNQDKEYVSCSIKKFCKTAEQLENMTKGAVYRELSGSYVRFGDINGESQNEVFIVQCGSAERKSVDDHFKTFNVTWTESFKTLKEAVDKCIDIPNAMWDTSGICFYDCVGTDEEQFDGMDNEDIATYLVTSLDRKELMFAIRHQCLISKEDLIKEVLKYYKYGPSGCDHIQVEDIDRFIERALSMRERGVEVIDEREED